MLYMNNLSHHLRGESKTEHKALCSLSSHIHDDIITDFTISNLKNIDFLENIELIKSDFCEFLDTVANTLKANGVTVPENNIELPENEEGPELTEEPVEEEIPEQE